MGAAGGGVVAQPASDRTRYEAAAQGIAVSGERTEQAVLRIVTGSGADDAASSKPIAEQPVAGALGVNIYTRQVVDGAQLPPGPRVQVVPLGQLPLPFGR